MVTTQDVSFGMFWVKLVGASARWASGDEDAPPLHVVEAPGEARARAFGPGLVAVWVAGEAPVLICEPAKALRAIKSLPLGTSVEEIRRALRASGAVLREEDEPRRDSIA